ncbi:MAG: hypothetical protein ACP5XB_02935 [Isosphaeraceae bacterium]
MMGVFSARSISLLTTGMATLLLVGLGATMARAQSVVPSTSPSAPASAGSPTGEPASPLADVVFNDVPDLEGPESAPSAAPRRFPSVPAIQPNSSAMGPLAVIKESLFGAASKDDWQPLSLSTFFSEGWDQPFVRSPKGTNQAPKQNWFGAADGVFVRLNSLSFFFTNNLGSQPGLLLAPFPWAPVKSATAGNEYFATYNLYMPLNRRLELLVAIPFIASNLSSPTGHYVGNFGDLTFSERFRLVDRRNFSMQALLTERTPTGKTVNGNDITFITPALEFWWNFAPRWVVRGGTGINIDTGRTSATSTYFTNLAVGRYLTTRDARVCKSLAAHVVVSTLTDVLGRKGYITDVYVSPGIRFSLDRELKWSVIGGVEVPVTGPQPFVWQPGFALVYAY